MRGTSVALPVFDDNSRKLLVGCYLRAYARRQTGVVMRRLISFGLSSWSLAFEVAATERLWRLASEKLVHGLHNHNQLAVPNSRLLARQTVARLLRNFTLAGCRWRPALVKARSGGARLMHHSRLRVGSGELFLATPRWSRAAVGGCREPVAIGCVQSKAISLVAKGSRHRSAARYSSSWSQQPFLGVYACFTAEYWMG